MRTNGYALLGGAFGLALFLAVALLPMRLYGGYAGVVRAGGVFGLPLQARGAVRVVVALAMSVGALGFGALFAVAGAAVGATVARVAGVARNEAEANA